MRDAAGWAGDAVPDAVPAEAAQEARLIKRYEMAVSRLQRKLVEQWRPKRRPADLSELGEWAENALHLLAGGVDADAMEDGGDDPLAVGRATKGKKPLTASAKEQAVSSRVAARCTRVRRRSRR